MWPGKVRVFAYHACLCYFGDAFVMQYIRNLLKASLVYSKRLTICVQCTLLVFGLWLSQTADSAELNYAVALHFAFCRVSIRTAG